MTTTTKASTGHATLVEALAAVQASLPTVGKGKTAKVPTKNGGSYSYSYADLADVTQAVLPLLAAHGLAFTCSPTFIDGKYLLEGKLLHRTGEFVSGWFPLPTSDAQSIGSALTYGRRYLLGCLTGVVTDDDEDGSLASAGPSRAAAAERNAAQPEPDPAAPETPKVDAEQAYADYSTRLAQAPTQEALANVATEIVGDRTLTGARRGALKQQFDARMQALATAGKPEPEPGAAA